MGLGIHDLLLVTAVTLMVRGDTWQVAACRWLNGNQNIWLLGPVGVSKSITMFKHVSRLVGISVPLMAIANPQDGLVAR